MDIYVINRDDRPERLSDFIVELQNQDLNAHKFSAIIDKTGWKGCAKSHLALLKEIGYNKEMLILEDDVVFLVPDLIRHLDLCRHDLPDDWDCLYLGGSPQEPQEKYTDFLYRARNVLCAHAILWRKRAGGAVEYTLAHKGDIKKIDDYFAKNIQLLFNCYMARPILATQMQYKSDTCLRSDVSTILINYKKFCQ
jgi:GR25 family glycosyltransferase involved in LPS biosynthesis